MQKRNIFICFLVLVLSVLIVILFIRFPQIEHYISIFLYCLAVSLSVLFLLVLITAWFNKPLSQNIYSIFHKVLVIVWLIAPILILYAIAHYIRG